MILNKTKGISKYILEHPDKYTVIPISWYSFIIYKKVNRSNWLQLLEYGGMMHDAQCDNSK